MQILKFPHQLLFKPTQKIINITPQIKDAINDMHQLMILSKGIGLAANQVGIDANLFVMKALNANSYAFLNPEITSKSPEIIEFQEGCLSFPGLRCQIKRNSTLTLKWIDINGKTYSQEFSGIEAICIQHEIEHLNGKTFIDNLSPLKRSRALKTIYKQL